MAKISRKLFDALRARRGSVAEKGYVMAMTAMLILPLVGAVGVAVDLGAWYARAAQVQRVTDAASLAGVIYLPNTGRATEVALNTVRANGIPVVGNSSPASTADGRITVTVTPILTDTSRLSVDIVENDSDQYFSGIFTSDVSVGRKSTAEFIKPVAMGSPKNYLGTGQLWTGADRENFKLAISGQCASREQGERIMTLSDGNFTTNNNPPSGGNSFGGCQPGSPAYVEANPEFDANGYFYAFEVPAGFSGSMQMQVYDAPNCSSSDFGDSAGRQTMRFTVRDADSPDPRTATILRTVTVGPTDSGCRAWRGMHTFTNPTPGIYYLQVQSVAPANPSSASQEGSNSFALRAVANGSWQRCSADAGAATTSSPYRTDCVQVYGTQHMGVLADFAGTTPTFFLADLGPEHSGKILEITLWDMGEGTERLRILNPNQTAVNYRYTVLCLNGDEPSGGSCPGEDNPTGGRSGTTSNLDTSGSGHRQPGAHRLSSSRYNDRLIRIEVQLPEDISSAYSGRTWWRVQYTACTGSGCTQSDRTTWSVIVRGDPVRLVPN